MRKNSYDSRNKINIKSALFAGFIASAISGIFLATLTAIAAIPEFDFVAIEGSIFGLTSAAISAWIIYFIIGMFIFGLSYALLEPYLKGESGTSRGIVFGFIVWIVVMIAFMPLAGAGLFLAEYGIAAAVIVLVTDIIYGAALGYFYHKQS